MTRAYGFDQAWSEAAGDVPAPGTALHQIYTSPAAREAWSDGEPMLQVITPALVQPAPWHAWGNYAGT